MAFGVKIKNLTMKNSYSIESFYEAIKDKQFTAGQPSLSKHGVANVITFPEIDSQNQVWILKNGFGKETKKFTVQKQEKAGLGNMASNIAADKLTGGVFGFGKVVGGNSKKCEELVEITAKELAAMDL